jgi:hypothetical protein
VLLLGLNQGLRVLGGGGVRLTDKCARGLGPSVTNPKVIERN